MNTSYLFLLLALALPLVLTDSAPQNDDTYALTQFRLQTDAHASLLPNWTGNDACATGWRGVECSPNGRVVSLTLASLNLRGLINSLSALTYLRFLDLHDNRLNGTVSPLSNCTSLELLYLSRNDFSGEIPPEISSLKLLVRLDLSDNNLRGPVPERISRLTHLITLRLQNNALSGKVPDFSSSLVNLSELNMTNNELLGHLPDPMLNKFGIASFAGNGGLCGSSPLPKCSFSEITTPSGNNSSNNETVSSKPSSLPQPSSDINTSSKSKKNRGLSAGVTVAIVVAVCVVVLVVVSFAVAHCCAGERTSSSMVESESGKRRSESSYRSEKKVYANGERDQSDGSGVETERSQLMFFDRRNRFELEDLLRASAEMLGKGSLGTVYRAVLDDGCTVAVKRLKDANPCERSEFEQYMDVVGKMKHPNIVRLRAYYYAKEEKLLVYDYLPNGSLHNLLHGNRGPGRIPVDWTTRISLVLGAARGLARIHAEYSAAKIPHGNIKSSNVLLDNNGIACISDFGLSLLLNPIHAIARLGGYRAPEQSSENQRLSQQADVYSFGVLILEILTGRAPSQYPSPARPRLESEHHHQEQDMIMDLPRWVRTAVKDDDDEWCIEVFDEELRRYKNIEDELVAMMHVGLACVEMEPEKRPSMLEVVKMVEDIRVEQSPIVEDFDESRNSLSPSIPTTEDECMA